MLLDVQGHQVYCYTGGKAFNPQLPAIVLLHGAQNDHSVWALQSRSLAHHGYAVLAPDLPGHGRSGGPALKSVEAMAGWLLALLDAAGVGQAIFAGHSMGSLIALEAADQAPARALGLALLGTTYPMKVADALLDTARSDEGAAIEMVARYSHSSYFPGPSTAGPGNSVVNVARRLMQRMGERNSAQLFHTDFAACNAYANGEVAAGAVTCPTMFVLGTKDAMTPLSSAKLLTDLIADGMVVRVDAGHAMMMEAPDAVLDAMLGLAAAVTRLLPAEQIDKAVEGTHP